MGNGTRPTPPPPATSAPSNSSNPILYIAIAAAIGVGGYFLFSNKGSEKTDAPTKPVTEQVVSESASSTSTSETTKKQSNKQNKTTSSVKQSQAAITPKVKEDSQSKKTPSYAAEPSTSTAKESVSVQPKLQTAGDYYSAAKVHIIVAIIHRLSHNFKKRLPKVMQLHITICPPCTEKETELARVSTQLFNICSKPPKVDMQLPIMN